jgi:hypothetical protein
VRREEKKKKVECNHTKIKKLRDSLSHKINRTVKARLDKTHNIPKYFVKTSYTNKQNSIDTNNRIMNLKTRVNTT